MHGNTQIMSPAVAGAAASRAWAKPVFQNRWSTLLSLMTADLAALFLAGGLAFETRYLFGGLDPSTYVAFLALPIFFIALFTIVGLYPGVGLNPVEEFRRLWIATGAGFLTTITAVFLSKQSDSYSRLVMMLAWALSLVLLVAFRAAVRLLCAGQDWWGVPIVILGAGQTGGLVFETLRKYASLGLKPVAILDDDGVEFDSTGIGSGQVITGPLSLAPKLVRDFGIRHGCIAMPGASTRDLDHVLRQHAHGFEYLLIVPNLVGLSSLWVTARDFGGLLALEVRQTLIHRTPRLLKRAIDAVLSASALVLLSPLFAILILTVRLTSAGPVFYGQRRVGLNEEPFTAWKFRSMVMNADAILKEHLHANPALREEWARDHKLRNDPRITLIGSVMRKTSLDELPQLWNVLLGQMSLVGPRPIVQAEISKYGNHFDFYRRVRPGITGLWQVSGRNNTSYAERVQYDGYYVRNWSVWLDLYILMRTVKTVLFTEGAF